MGTLSIPTIGTRLTLLEDWAFRLHQESRNWNFLKKMMPIDVERDSSEVVMLPAGTALKVERLYIRSHYRDFDSVTFRIMPNESFSLKGRFWAHLKDVNNMICSLDKETFPLNREELKVSPKSYQGLSLKSAPRKI